MEIYLPITVQEVFFTSQRVVFIVTSLLNALAMFCLLRETPPNQAGIRKYLIFIQVVVGLSSVYLDILFVPIPTFPAIAGYCVGLLCSAGIRPHSVLGVFVLLLVLVGTAIISCSFYRHQTIIPASNPLRTTCTAIQVVLTVIMSANPIAYAIYPFDRADVMGILRKNPFNLTWIIERGPFFIHERGAHVLVAISLVDSDLILCAFIVLFLFWHMIHVLSGEKNRSASSLKRIRNSLIVLFIQIAVPLSMIVIPAFLLFTSLACECIPFAITLPAYFVLTLHPLVHNIILLSITPTYRRYIIKKISRRNQPSIMATSFVSGLRQP